LYVVMQVFVNVVHLPNIRRMNALIGELAARVPDGPGGPDGPDGPPPQAVELSARGKSAARNTKINHLLLAAILVLMVWGPRGGV
jgi:hypothetical protein